MNVKGVKGNNSALSGIVDALLQVAFFKLAAKILDLLLCPKCISPHVNRGVRRDKVNEAHLLMLD